MGKTYVQTFYSIRNLMISKYKKNYFNHNQISDFFLKCDTMFYLFKKQHFNAGEGEGREWQHNFK